MKKAIFKKILCSINYMNLQDDHLDIVKTLLKQLQEEEIHMKEEDLQHILTYILKIGILYKDHVGYDLTPCGCVFAKANNGSISEALALFECILKQPDVYHELSKAISNGEEIPLHTLLDATSFDFITQTLLWDNQKQCVQSTLYLDLLNIVKEYENTSLIISTTLTAIYANELIDHKDDSLKYRNQDSTIVDYKKITDILRLIPKKGIPENRDVTRSTQSFYKDTLLHEFHHTCPVCGIDIPHMLIASHIKPFRDCAHIFETLDHYNGLLLCRNHDYLFDQGLFSFDVDGLILISSTLLEKHNLEIFGIQKNSYLSKEYLQENRDLFLKYHREHIFKA